MKNLHELIGLAVPTNEPEVAKRLLFSDESLKNLAPIAKFTTFLINFQKPWTIEEITEVTSKCTSYGFEVRYKFNEYNVEGKGLIPFNKIRFDACNLMPEAKFFVLTDDDFKYQDGAANDYLQSIHYLLHHSKCGFVLMKGRCYLKELPKDVISPMGEFRFRCITDKGIILKNIDKLEGLAMPNEALGLVGSDEEKVCCSWRMHEGYYGAVKNRCRTLHYENNNTSDESIKVESGEDMYGWNKKDILDANNNKFIRDNFYADFKNGGWRLTALVDQDEFIRKTNLDFRDDTTREFYMIDYSGAEVDGLSDEIMRMIEEKGE